MTLPLSHLAEVVDEKRLWTPDWYDWLTELAQPIVSKVTGLPPAKVLGAGARAFANDATVTTFGSIVVGGGTNFVPLYSDGLAWRIG